ncbi:MAG: argininosuccinate synthase [SAR202 cluster bacterium]|nr:argininosuccinate synthase [SAR202 cluster bacterium]|tara:strand:- start:2914 stop:4134 length:1221 start_codon:yes stop_codon:yes gene_type:complete
MSKGKCVLAYSGGMDSTISVVWIKEKYDLDVITLTVDLGAGPEIEGVREKSKSAGAIDSVVIDAKDEFVNEYIFPALKSGGMYEDVYALSTALARPLMSKKLVETARKYGAGYVSHGCTGKGNDQVRFDASIMTLSGDGESIKIIAPAREWGMTRDEEKEYAAKAGLELREVGDNNRVYSIDRNLWGLAIEGEDLEDTWVEPPEDAFSWTSNAEDAPDTPEIIEIGFDKGIPISLNGEKIDGVTLIEKLNVTAGKHGIGRVDHLENRLVGIKSREVYETPAAIILYNAISALETATLSREQQRIKSNLSKIYSDLVYDGRWFTLLRENIESFMNSAQKFSSGDVKLKLYKGNVTVIGRKSKYSLYDYDMSTYSTTDSFNHQSAEGFIDIYSLPSRIQAKKQKFNDL